jgi:hypothetical protein
MSEKQRQKKDGEDKNNQRMKGVAKNADEKNTSASRQDRSGSGMGKKS